MQLKRAFEAGPFPRWLAGTLGALLLLAAVATVTAEPPERLKDRDGRSLITADHLESEMLMDRNRVLMWLVDNGQIGGRQGSVAGGGFWITQQNQYIFSSGPNLGAEIPNGDGDGNEKDTAMFIGGPFSQVEFGSLEFAKLPNSLGLGHGATASAGKFWTSTFAPDEDNFPEPCTVDAFRISLFPSLQPFEGEPFPGFADQTVCFATNDISGGICADCGGKRLGTEVVSTTFAFGVPAVQDFVFVAWRVYNRSEFINASNSPSNAAGPYTFENAILGIAIDPDVGDSGDDQITFFPDIGTMIYWDSNFSEPGFVGTPGFGAVSVFPVPDPETGESFSLESFTVFVRGTIRPDPESPQEWYEGLSGDPSFVAFEVQPTDIRGMTSTNRFNLEPGAFVEIYGAYFFAPVAGTPPNLLLAEKPFLADNRTPDPAANNDPAFANIVRVQQTAQATFDAGFVVPVAPPKPGITLVPGDNQVTITWNANPVEFVNPFAKVARDPFNRLSDGQPNPDAPGQGVFLNAGTIIYVPTLDQGGTTGFVTAGSQGLTGAEVTNPAFNPNFVIQDFQGFRVYRSLTGSPQDAELIAQFDLSDAISGGVFCVSAVPVFDANGDFVENVCTTQEELTIGENTGLNFAVIDRGGSFPPSSGPGLINGIPVFYSVTSFSVNGGQSPVSIPEGTSVVPPAAPLVLEGGILPFEQATPRSDPSSLTNATVGEAVLLDGDGNEVGDTGPMPVDADGNLTGNIPPARDWDLDLKIVQPTEIPRDFEVMLHIDNYAGAASHTVEFAVFCHAFDNLGTCLDTGALFSEVPAGPSALGERLELRVTDGAGNVLQTPTGPAEGITTGFGPGSFSGNTPISSPEIQILSPENPENGVAFTLTYETVGGPRNQNCAQFGACALVNEMPAGVAEWGFGRANYLQTLVATVEVTWSNQAGQLSFSSVRDISNNVDLGFADHLTHVGWGFHAPTGLRAGENALATALGVPRMADGRVLFPDPLCLGSIFDCDFHHTAGPFTQGAPIWTDLPVDPNIFDRLAGGSDWPSDPSVYQPGALQQNAAFVTVDGKQATRFWLAGHTVGVVFDQLPADGDTWTLHFPRGSGDGVNPDAVRGPAPGMAVRVPLSGATNELANADLSQIRVIPNPFIAADEIQRGRGLQRIQFTNLPPQATIRIYTISGNLVRVLEHTDGDGTMEWDVRTRFDLLAASGNYYYHVTTPDGRTHLGRFAIVN